MKTVIKIILIFSSIRLIPHILYYNLTSQKAIIKQDVLQWQKKTYDFANHQLGFVKLMTFLPEFRNLFYKRIGPYHRLISWLCPRMNTLFIATDEIGPGLFIQHGFATIIAASSIGQNCSINQQVTIGFSGDKGCPTLGDNVLVSAGAKIVGNVFVGNNSVVGTNAVIVKDVPANCTVVGVPAYIIKRNGNKVHEKL